VVGRIGVVGALVVDREGIAVGGDTVHLLEEKTMSSIAISP